MIRMARWSVIGCLLLTGAAVALPGPAEAQASTKAARPAKKAKAQPRRPVERQATQPTERSAPAPARDPVIDRAAGSAY